MTRIMEQQDDASGPEPAMVEENPVIPHTDDSGEFPNYQKDFPQEKTSAAPPIGKPQTEIDMGESEVNAAPPPSAPMTAQDYDNEDMMFSRDILQGHVQPETYRSLFGKKDTLGKIGSVFGLLLSGAGSGLSHQPNALLEMMNKEIDRDLDAQKSNMGKAQNFLNSAYRHEIDRSTIKRNEELNFLTRQQTEEAKERANYLNTQGRVLDDQNAGIRAVSLAKNGALASSIKELSDQSIGNPAAQNAIQTQLMPAAEAQMQQNNAKANAQIQLNTDAFNKKNPPPYMQSTTQSAVDMAKMNKLINAGRLMPELPNAIPPAEAQTVIKEAERAQDNRVIAQAYDHAFKELNKMAQAGILNPQKRKALINTLGAKIAVATANRYVSAEAAAQADGIFPSALDWGSARPEKYNEYMNTLRGVDSSLINLQRYGLKTPFPNYSFNEKENSKRKGPSKLSSQKEKPPGPQEGQKAKSNKGRPMIYQKGKWILDMGAAQ